MQKGEKNKLKLLLIAFRLDSNKIAIISFLPNLSSNPAIKNLKLR